MTQWQATTRGGDPVENLRSMHDNIWRWRGQVINPDGSRSTLTWTERGYHGADEKPRKDDLIPIEPEAPIPAKVRVDLALAAHSLRAAVVEFQRAEDQKDNLARVLLDSFAESGKTEVVVKIKGENYFFWTQNAKVFFRKIEVL